MTLKDRPTYLQFCCQDFFALLSLMFALVVEFSPTLGAKSVLQQIPKTWSIISQGFLTFEHAP